MSTSEFLALLALATAVSFTPGPNTTLSAAIAANRGLRAALRFVLAVPVGWSLLLVLCAAGVGGLILAVPALRWGVLALGVGYMLWLAWQLAGNGTLAEAHAGRLHVGFWQGVLLQFLNIKAWMLALSIAAGWIGAEPDWPQRLLVVLPVLLGFAFSSNFSYALLGSVLRQWLAQGRRLLWFNRVMALALAATALWMGWDALGSALGWRLPWHVGQLAPQGLRL